MISLASINSVILSFLLPKNQRSSLYFQNKASLKINDPLFFTSKKSAILSFFTSKKQHPPKISDPLSFLLPKIQHPLFLFLKKQHPQKSVILSLFTSKKNSGGYGNQRSSLFYFQKSSIPQNQQSSLFLLPKLPKNSILSLLTSKKTW